MEAITWRDCPYSFRILERESYGKTITDYTINEVTEFHTSYRVVGVKDNSIGKHIIFNDLPSVSNLKLLEPGTVGKGHQEQYDIIEYWIHQLQQGIDPFLELKQRKKNWRTKNTLSAEYKAKLIAAAEAIRAEMTRGFTREGDTYKKPDIVIGKPEMSADILATQNSDSEPENGT